MNLSELASVGSSVFSGVCLVAGAIYVRGQKDGDLASLKRDMAEIKKALSEQDGRALTDAHIQGAQSVRNSQLAEVLKEVRALRDDIIKFSQRLIDHERGCGERVTAQELRFSKIDRNIEHVEASIRNVALGENDRFRSTPPRTVPPAT